MLLTLRLQAEMSVDWRQFASKMGLHPSTTMVFYYYNYMLPWDTVR